MNFDTILGHDPTAVREIGKNLRAYRIHLVKCSQEEMAKRIGISRSTYSRMEAGDPRIPVGCWIGAWRRLYLDRDNDLSVLDGLLSVLDPTEPLARDQMQRTHAEICRQRGEGDIVDDSEREVREVMAMVMADCQDNPECPKDEFEEGTVLSDEALSRLQEEMENHRSQIEAPDEIGATKYESRHSLRLREIRQVVSSRARKPPSLLGGDS
jgi:transcriptional regulator with XRE-family HTH domain